MTYQKKVNDRCNIFELSGVILLFLSFGMMISSMITPSEFLRIWLSLSIMNASLHYIKTGTWSLPH